MNLPAPDPEEETHITRCGIPYAFVMNEEGFTLRRTDGEMVSDEEYEDLLDYVQEEGWSSETTSAKNRQAMDRHSEYPGFPAFKMPPPLVPCPQVKRKAPTPLTQILTNTLIRFQGLQRLFCF